MFSSSRKVKRRKRRAPMRSAGKREMIAEVERDLRGRAQAPAIGATAAGQRGKRRQRRPQTICGLSRPHDRQ